MSLKTWRHRTFGMALFVYVLGYVLAALGWTIFIGCSVLMVLDQGWGAFFLSLLNPITYLFGLLLLAPGHGLILLGAWLKARQVERENLSETQALQEK
jgi:hypothetical protein